MVAVSSCYGLFTESLWKIFPSTSPTRIQTRSIPGHPETLFIMALTKNLKSPKPAKKTVHSSVGAPSQHNQASRKGKRAWRKNVDIGDVEEGLEGLRAEERVTG